MTVFLSDDEICLRSLAIDEDLTNYLSFVNDAEHLKWVDGIGHMPISLSGLKEYLENNNNLFLSIFNADNEHVGNIQLSCIDHLHRSAMYGCVISQKFSGNGFGKKASKLIIQHGFDNLNLHRIYLTVISENKPAIQTYEQLGFVKEGIEREMHFLNGNYYDGIRYSLLESEYRAANRDKN